MSKTMEAKSPNIITLWHDGTEEQWREALAGYYNFPHVNFEMEQYMDAITPDVVRNMSGEGFYKFLHDRYFPWKFTAYLPSIRAHLEKSNSEQGMKELFDIKERLLKAYAIAPEDTELLLCVVTRIGGLSVIGASGLLAIIFPQHYGTLDQFVVKSLKKIRDLPEQREIAAIDLANIKLKDSPVLENVMRRKAKELNLQFGSDEWTPKKIDMVLWYKDR